LRLRRGHGCSRSRCILWVLCYRDGTHMVRKPGIFDSSGCALRTMWAREAGHFGLGCGLIAIRVNGFCHAALTWRDRRTLDDPRGRRPVPASAWRLRRLRPPPVVIVLRRLEVGATVKGREALPHGHCVADCPLLLPSRRLAQPGRHYGIGGLGASRRPVTLPGEETQPSPGKETGWLLAVG